MFNRKILEKPGAGSLLAPERCDRKREGRIEVGSLSKQGGKFQREVMR
jgi:hypothetical protein